MPLKCLIYRMSHLNNDCMEYKLNYLVFNFFFFNIKDNNFELLFVIKYLDQKIQNRCAVQFRIAIFYLVQ